MPRRAACSTKIQGSGPIAYLTLRCDALRPRVAALENYRHVISKERLGRLAGLNIYPTRPL